MLDPKVFTLLKIVETGSYTQAAKALNLSQPAVSQHIRALETALDIRIFERVGNQEGEDTEIQGAKHADRSAAASIDYHKPGGSASVA